MLAGAWITRVLRAHNPLVVDIEYDTKSYSIKHRSSANLNAGAA